MNFYNIYIFMDSSSVKTILNKCIFMYCGNIKNFLVNKTWIHPLIFIYIFILLYHFNSLHLITSFSLVMPYYIFYSISTFLCTLKPLFVMYIAVISYASCCLHIILNITFQYILPPTFVIFAQNKLIHE